MFSLFPNLETAQQHAQAHSLRQRVCVYIVRGLELLVFAHTPEYPTAGIQVPAGGLEPDETILAAALREGAEETGLTDLHSPVYLGSGLYQNGMVRQVWHFVWVQTSETRNAWEHLAEGQYTFLHRFEPLERVQLHYSMDAMLPELGQHLGLGFNNLGAGIRPVVICYITRGNQILIFSGHPDGGIGVPAGGIEDGETPEEAAKREILEESGLILENPVYLGRQDYYFKGNHPENGTPLEFYEDRYYYHFEVTDSRDAWEWVVSDGVGDKGKVFKHSFVPLEQAKIDWDMNEFLLLLEEKL